MEIANVSGYGVRLENSARRIMSHGNERERVTAEFWKKFNVPRSMQGHTAMGDIIGQNPHETVDEQTAAVMNTFAQWLGSHVGAVFIRELIQFAAERGHPFHELDRDFLEVRETVHRLT